MNRSRKNIGSVKSNNIDELCINTIRFLSIEAVQNANSGHPGMPMGAAPMAYILWTRHLKHNPADPKWFDRDRFILSAGHGSMLLYSLLHLTGYNLSLDDIKQFRQWGSSTPGHPEKNHTPGVEVTTGPLGQGFANGVGMASAEAHLAARFNRKNHKIIDHFTYVIAGDGDMMEGITAEAASLAAHLELGKLICLYDSNHISLAATTNISFTEDVAGRFVAYGWHVQTIEDGNDLVSIDKALINARKESRKPSLIVVHTHIGYGSPNMQDKFEAHGKPLGEDEIKKTKQNLDWPAESQFYIPDKAKAHFSEAPAKGKIEQGKWNSQFEKYRQEYPELAEELDLLITGELPDKWSDNIPVFSSDDADIATRAASYKIINAIAPELPSMIGGSADLDPSTNTTIKDMGDFLPGKPPDRDVQGTSGGEMSYAGRNLHYGVREHAMAAMANGMAAHGGLLPFIGTFLVFSDYMRPSIRLASLMKLPVKFIFTHDSIAVGEDGPTHQPVEHIASLRAVPGLIVIRPADANETAVAWQVAMETRDHPVALILTRQKLPIFDRNECAPADGLRRGAYILNESTAGEPDLILIATGSEVSLALEAQKRLSLDQIETRVVSMPSWELFEMQTADYRRSVLPDSVTARLSIEAGSKLGWREYVGDRGEIIGIDRFGASAPGRKVMSEYGLSIENIYGRALALLKEHRSAS